MLAMAQLNPPSGPTSPMHHNISATVPEWNRDKSNITPSTKTSIGVSNKNKQEQEQFTVQALYTFWSCIPSWT